MSWAQHEENEAEFLYHEPCPSCGSSDANSVYTDGHKYCFSCGHYDPGSGNSKPRTKKGRSMAKFIQGTVRGIRSRKITDETANIFGYQHARSKKHGLIQISPYYDADGTLVAQKVRTKDKDFFWVGESTDALPFGSQVWPKSGKKLVVTEGEIDAMAMSQVQGNKWPVVSISCGAGTEKTQNKIRKYISKHIEYFRGFDEVILMFDMDEPGRDSTAAAAEVLGGRARIATLPLKDAGEMLKQGRTNELVQAMWGAKPYRPQGIVELSTLKDRIKERPREGLSWPFPELTKLTFGIRTGELCALGAGTGVGKTDLFTQSIEWLVREHGLKVGVISLEQEPTETGLRLAGKFAKRPFHDPDMWDEELFDTAFDSMIKQGQVFLYDHFGRADWDDIRSKIEYLYHQEGVQYFFLDHLTALAPDSDREQLDDIMGQLGGLVKSIPIWIFFISHLTTPDGKPHEEGGRVTIRHFRGSRSIGFWSHFMFGMERDQQADDPRVRCTTTFRVLKDRFTGRSTGSTFYLGYDHETGMLSETVAPDIDAGMFGFDEEEGGTNDF